MNELLDSGTGQIMLGAGLTLAGVIAGWAVSTFPARATAQRLRTGRAKVEARQLAVRTVITLDDFVGACQAAVNDSPDFNPADPGEFVFHTEDPHLVLPRDVDWNILKPELLEELLWMQSRIRNVLDALDSLDIEPPVFDHLFERREEDFSRLGLRALDLIETISSEYDIVKPERPSYHDPRRDFQERIDRISASRNRRRKVEASQKGEASNITPLFSKSRRESSQSSLDADPKV